MSLIDGSTEGWKLNRINVGPPYAVQPFGPYAIPQVCDERGTVALSGPCGAIASPTIEHAKELCRMANAGELERI